MSTGAHNMLKNDVESDIQIGAVELKDHENDVRVSVGDDGVAYIPAQRGVFIAGPAIIGSPTTPRVVSVSPVAGRQGMDVNVLAGGGATAVPNRTSFDPRQITVVTAGTPVQFPSIAIPDGFALTIKNSDQNGGGDIVFIGTSAASVVVAATRYRLTRGETIALKLDDADRVFVDANANGTVVELIVET